MKHGSLLAVFTVLVAANVLVFGRTLSYGFVNYDDLAGVCLNTQVMTGVSLENVVAAFFSKPVGGWFPLTQLSHVLDAEMFGLWPGGHHLTSLVLHIANTCLLFAGLRQLTAKPWRSAVVALLFAVHPLHVEPVVWVSSRKDVLSTLFMFLGIWSYLAYAKRHTKARMVLVIAIFVLAMLAKTTVATYPAALLLLDYWPLRRDDRSQHQGQSPGSTWRSLIVEKAEFLPTVLALVVVQYLVQGSSGALGGNAAYPPGERVAAILVGYTEYLRLTIWPTGLSAYYPIPEHGVPLWSAAVSFVVLAAISWTAIALRNRYRFALVGWLWFLVTLAPVVGFFRLGSQAMADRFTYVPLIGIFVATVWGAAEIGAGLPRARPLATSAASVLIAGSAAAASAQVDHWQDSVSLWRRCLQVTTDNRVARHQLGRALELRGRGGEALCEYVHAFGFGAHGITLESLTRSAARQQHIDEARLERLRSIGGFDGEQQFARIEALLLRRIKACRAIHDSSLALRRDSHAQGVRLALQQELPALVSLSDAIAQRLDRTDDPGAAAFHRRRSSELSRDDEAQRAEGHAHEVMRIAPASADGYTLAGEALMRRRRFDHALQYYVEALCRDKHHADAQRGAQVARRAWIASRQRR